MSLVSRMEALHEEAARQTGLHDFGPGDYREPMRLLLADYDRLGEAGGIEMAAGATVGILVARLTAYEGFKRHPDFAAARIEKPIIILGMPRTGTTSLQRLLAKDPGCQYLVPWLGNAPQPRPPRDTWEADPMFQATHAGLEMLYQIAPMLRAMHPMCADQADECRYAMEPSMWSPALAFAGVVGDYAQWMVSADRRPAYDYFRRVLGLIAGGDRRHWILKDPTTHLWAPETMLEFFPDARLVFTHREPVTALASVADMLLNIRRLRQRGITPEQNGAEHVALWAPAVERTAQVLERLPASQVLHVHIRELNDDPVGTAQRIYGHFEMPVGPETLDAWRQHAGADARSGHGEHRYKAEASGIDARRIEALMPTYCDFYRRRYSQPGVSSEHRRKA